MQTAWRKVWDSHTDHPGCLFFDSFQTMIFPQNYASSSYVPFHSTGDGNCLFNSASLAIWQNEKQAVELRLRTCLELALNQVFYRQHPVVVNAQIQYHSRKHGHAFMSVPTLFDLTCFDAEPSEVYQKKGFEAAFNHEIMRTARNYSYSGTLQILGLASILGVPVETLFPALLPIYQNVFLPRQRIISVHSAQG